MCVSMCIEINKNTHYENQPSKKLKPQRYTTETLLDQAIGRTVDHTNNANGFSLLRGSTQVFIGFSKTTQIIPRIETSLRYRTVHYVALP